MSWLGGRGEDHRSCDCVLGIRIYAKHITNQAGNVTSTHLSSTSHAMPVGGKVTGPGGGASRPTEMKFTKVNMKKVLEFWRLAVHSRGFLSGLGYLTAERQGIGVSTFFIFVYLKVPKREIFDRSDFSDFYTIKSSWVGDLLVKILTYYFNF
jgi:hypothetical protein